MLTPKHLRCVLRIHCVVAVGVEQETAFGEGLVYELGFGGEVLAMLLEDDGLEKEPGILFGALADDEGKGRMRPTQNCEKDVVVLGERYLSMQGEKCSEKES